MDIKTLSIVAMMIMWTPSSPKPSVEIGTPVPIITVAAPIEATLKPQATMPIVEPPAPPAPVYAPLASNAAKAFIYAHESGNNPLAKNSIGCLGLGQACPGSKLLAVCPSLEYSCQDNFFTNYAIQSYGSWDKAYEFWIAHSWW